MQWCKDRDVVLQAYSPLVRNTRATDPLLTPLAHKYQRTPTQILLRWGLQKGFVILPKSVTRSRMEENRSLYDFALSPEDMAGLETKEYAPCTWDPTVAPLSG